MGAFFIHKNFARQERKNAKGELHMSRKWLTYDLQFFADGDSADEGAEEPEVNENDNADPDEVDGETEGEEAPEEEDRDSIYAAARRRAESEARAKYAKEQSERDAYFANLCQGRVNPETGQPITSEAEYMEALNAQQRMNVNQELQEKGIDPSIIDRYIANSPEIQQQKKTIAEMQAKEARNQVNEDIKTIMALDKSYESIDSLTQSEPFQKAVEMCQQTPGLRLPDAYKIVNFEALRSAGARAAKQAAVNEAKGKGHLVSSPNTPTGNGGVEIPEADLDKWKKFYPGKSVKELNALYAKVKAH